jgi:hypothetical protein
MSDERTVVLCVETKMHGSKCKVDMGYTVDEWNAMFDDEQNDICNEYMANVCNVWTETDDGKPI